MEANDFKPVCYNIQNGDSYFYLGNDTYKNIRTNNEGVIKPELAQKALKVDLNASDMLNFHPQVAEMINRLNLKITK